MVRNFAAQSVLNDGGGGGVGPTPPFGAPAPPPTIPPPPAPAPSAPQLPPAADPGQTERTPGSTGPDTLNNLPGVLAALALEQQGTGQLDAQLKAQRDRLIEQFGDPSLAALAGFGVDPSVAGFAQQNTSAGNSILAQLAHSHSLNARSIINDLASHGLLFSGDTGYREGQENQAYGNNVYGAQQSVLDQLASLYGNYISQRQGLQQNTLTARQQAITDYLNNPDAYAGILGLGHPSAHGDKSGPVVTQPTAPTSLASLYQMLNPPPPPSDVLARYLRNRA